MIYKGVSISSRRDLAHELQLMQKFIDELPRSVSKHMLYVWCDSKACADYSIGMRELRWYPAMAYKIHKAFLECGDGYNGVHIREGNTLFEGKELCELDPYWVSDLEGT